MNCIEVEVFFFVFGFLAGVIAALAFQDWRRHG